MAVPTAYFVYSTPEIVGCQPDGRGGSAYTAVKLSEHDVDSEEEELCAPSENHSHNGGAAVQEDGHSFRKQAQHVTTVGKDAPKSVQQSGGEDRGSKCEGWQTPLNAVSQNRSR